MDKRNITEQGIDLAYLIFMLNDAQTGIAGMLKGQTKGRIKQIFGLMWAQVRQLSRELDLASSQMEQEKNLPVAEIETEMATEAEFFIACAEAKLLADRAGTSTQLLQLIKTFRYE